jgi:hypothetical protein
MFGGSGRILYPDPSVSLFSGGREIKIISRSRSFWRKTMTKEEAWERFKELYSEEIPFGMRPDFDRAVRFGYDACLNRVCKCGMRGDGVYCLLCGGKIEEES